MTKNHEQCCSPNPAPHGLPAAKNLPLKTGLVFEGISGALGSLLRRMCEVEDQLAGLLHPHPLGTATANGDDSWTLCQSGQELVLVHVGVGERDMTTDFVQASESRFDFDNDWNDERPDNVEHYVLRVEQAIANFKPFTIQPGC